MFRIRFLCLTLATVLTLGLAGSAWAAEVDCDSTYCFTSQDFADEEDQASALLGICITGLPAPQTGTVLLGTRVLQPGDILTSEQLAQMTFSPLRTETDTEAQVTYLPIFANRVGKSEVMTISIKGKKDAAPAAQDFSVETYKNLPIEGALKVNDPEGQAMFYTLVRSPKRGEVLLREDGSFLYTPKKNKVGVDSFTYTATDAAGNVSRVATATVQILKPSSNKQYADTVGQDYRFEAEWLRNTGLFVGETVSGETCFYGDKPVTRGEFLAMVVKLLDISTEDISTGQLPADIPDWLKPYLSAAIRSGLTAGLPESETGSWDADTPITGAEAAVMLQNALDLTVSQEMLESEQVSSEENTVPAWAATSLTILQCNGLALPAQQSMTRGQLAEALYQVSKLAINAPGTALLRNQ